MICPLCHAEMRDEGADRLDMSGERYLPAHRWACRGEKCEETVVVRPTGEPEVAWEWVTR